jgi:Ca-activated chloride channel family protein
MNLDANDPKWTAYALGEITDETERAEMERILEESGEIRRTVEEIRQTAGLLKEELMAEPAVHLTANQRERIEAKATAGRIWFGLKPAWVTACAAAAVLALSFFTYRQWTRMESTPSKTQMASAAKKESLPAILGDFEKQPALETRSATGANEKPAAAAPAASEKLKSSTDHLQDVKQMYYTAIDKGMEKKAPAMGEIMAAAPEPPKATPPPPTPLQQAALKGAVRRESGILAPTSEAKIQDAAERSLLETASSTETVAQAEPVKELPLVSSDVIDLAKVQKGAAIPVRTSGGIAGGMGFREAEMQVLPEPFPRREGRHRYQRQRGPFNTEAYDYIQDNDFLDVSENPLSTFSIDVDTASYSNVRRFLQGGSLPPKDAVRIEELVNYFNYDYKGPKDGKPFAAHFEITESPWNPKHLLLRIGLKGREIKSGKRPDGNLVFLLDVSGSMSAPNKLPLVKESMRLLVDQLTESDRVAIVVYSGDAHLHLPSTSGDRKERLRRNIGRLHAGGSTNGASGIQLAYETARINFIEGGVNRVILATDGDFNVGITGRGDLTRLIEKNAESGIYLSALGFGMGNYKDSTLEMLADKGRGNYAYIDTINEAKKVLVEQINSTLVPIAKDVKIQVEFNPRRVAAYRLIGYEDRIMPKEDFNDDTKKAGVIGAGHAVTALYELVPPGVSTDKPGVDPLKYQKPAEPSSSADSNELLTVKIRSKEPEKDKSVLSEFAVKDSSEKFSKSSRDHKFAAAVAAFGMVLRDSAHKGSANMEDVLDWAKEGKGADPHGYRQEFIRLIHRVISISD